MMQIYHSVSLIQGQGTLHRNIDKNEKNIYISIIYIIRRKPMHDHAWIDNLINGPIHS